MENPFFSREMDKISKKADKDKIEEYQTLCKDIFDKFGVIDIINKKVEKMLDTLWNPELEHNSRLQAFRDGIIHLIDEAFDFDEDEVRKKLNNINDEKRLINLLKLSARVDNIDTFLNRIQEQLI